MKRHRPRRASRRPCDAGGPEAEAYRRTIERTGDVDVRDPRLLGHREESAVDVAGTLVGSSVVAARRIGKEVLVDVDGGHTVALAFGLRGRLTLDGREARPNGVWPDRSPRDGHIRLVIETADRRLELDGQLRLARSRIDVDETTFGIDVEAITRSQLDDLCVATMLPLKSLSMDQRRTAGIGNLIADEVLYQARLDPRRRTDELGRSEPDRLWTGLRRTRLRVVERNGSHQGVMNQSGARRSGARCPRCRVGMRCEQLGGRTTFLCPEHQR